MRRPHFLHGIQLRIPGGNLLIVSCRNVANATSVFGRKIYLRRFHSILLSPCCVSTAHRLPQQTLISRLPQQILMSRLPLQILMRAARLASRCASPAATISMDRCFHANAFSYHTNLKIGPKALLHMHGALEGWVSHMWASCSFF